MFPKNTTFILFLGVNFFNLFACSSVVTQPAVVTQPTVVTQPAVVTQHALVVGIDQYQHAEPLQGAVNDAELLTKALRDIQVVLPENRVLHNDKATRARVIREWRNMVAQAKPGDTLIFTYAGHGAQKEDASPIDEKDKQDETLVLYEGHLTDDELTDLFIQANEYNILFVADACHSGGLTRAPKGDTCCIRYAGDTPPPQNSSAPPLTITTFGDEKENPARVAHVTFISAAGSDNESIRELNTFEDHKRHGALSWFLAKALAGYADGNHNQRLERYELQDYLTKKISDHTDGLYKPKLRPAGSQVVVILPEHSVTPAPPNYPKLRDIVITVEKGTAPSGLKFIQIADKSFDLRFVVKDEEKTEVYNQDAQITTISSQKAASWQRVIDKEQLLQALSSQFDMRLKPVKIELRVKPVKIELQEGYVIYKPGDKLHFSIAPTDTEQGLKALTLFNLAGNGELQFLYPLKRHDHPPIISQFPYKLSPIGVESPFGGDHLVAILCTKPPIELQKLLQDSAPYLPNPTQVIANLQKQRCQVGQYAVFTAEK